MAVFVDPSAHPYRGMVMCHMWADTLLELHAMADAVGLRRAWFQRPPKASWEHYDVCKATRARVVALGAIETDRFGPLEWLARRAGDEAVLARLTLRRSRSGHPRQA